LLIVADATDPYVTEHLSVVRETLREIDAQDVPSVLVLNKCDRPGASAAVAALRDRYPDAIPVSALRGEGLDRLRHAAVQTLSNAVSPCAGNLPA
jgi:GTP-binding protein HflX